VDQSISTPVESDHDFLCSISAAETFNHTDSEFLKADSSHSRDAGSTASTAILVGGRLVVANVGDSRAVVSKGGKGKFSVYSIFPVLLISSERSYCCGFSLWLCGAGSCT
jgi:protein phosphatase 1L